MQIYGHDKAVSKKSVEQTVSLRLTLNIIQRAQTNSLLYNAKDQKPSS